MSNKTDFLLAGRRALTRLGWHPGFREEARFWLRELALSGDHKDFVAASLDPERMAQVFPAALYPYLADIAGRFGIVPRVLDLGCGPASLLRLGHLRGALILTGLDPLADRYRDMLTAIDRAPDWSLRAGYGEDLAELFSAESFDLIFCCNALDHTQDPRLVVAAACAVLRPGGTLYLQGYVCEGASNRYRGLHQHDLYLSPANELMWRRRRWPWRRAGAQISLVEGLPLEMTAHSEPSESPGASLLAVYRRARTAADGPERAPVTSSQDPTAAAPCVQ